MPRVTTPADLQDALGALSLASDYIKAARLVATNLGSPFPVPAYFLVHHGIELTLKGFLRSNGVTDAMLKKKDVRHDLHALHKKAKETGLLSFFAETEADRAAMYRLVRVNSEHALRYIKDIGPREYPAWRDVESLAVRLHQAVAPTAGATTFPLL